MKIFVLKIRMAHNMDHAFGIDNIITTLTFSHCLIITPIFASGSRKNHMFLRWRMLWKSHVYVSCYLKPNICLLFLKKWNKNCEEPQTFLNFSIYHLTFVDWTEKNSSVISLFIYNRPSPDFHCFESHFDNGTRYIFQ